MGYFDESLKEQVEWPKVGPRREQQIGAFFIAWGVLERTMDNSFQVLFRIDPTLAPCIYANLGTQAKIDILSSATDALVDALGQRTVDATHRILIRVRTLADKARNTLAHGQHERYRESPQTPRRRWWLVRYVARKQQSMVLHPNDLRYWRKMTKAVVAVTTTLHRKMRAIHERLKKFSDAEMWQLSQIQWKIAEPVQLRRRKRPPPRKDGSKDHPPKRGTQSHTP